MSIGDMLLANQDIDKLDIDNDLFGTIEKGDAIKNLFLKHRDDLIEKSLRMIALYGRWGSGKTTLLNYIKRGISEEDTKVIFFKAWEMESDCNLALSLLEQIMDELYNDPKSKTIKEDYKLFGSTLLRLAKNIMLNTSIQIPGIGIDIGTAGKETINEMDRILDGKSQFSQIKKFKESFQDILEKMSNQTKFKKIYVFIDDLDRCEPENVINLISNIKLFFTLSDRIVFLCAIDKGAVSNALEIKYRNVLKAEEYLEKVFDLSFNMPEDLNLEKILNQRFPGDNNCKTLITCLFNYLKFNNPRKIVRLLNKYEMVKFNISLLEEGQLCANNDSLYIVFALFFLILMEFHNEKFKEFTNIENRMNTLKRINNLVNTPSIVNAKKVPKHWFLVAPDEEMLIADYLDNFIVEGTLIVDEELFVNDSVLHAFIISFTPLIDSEFKFVDISSELYDYEKYIKQFINEDNKIITSFIEFILFLAKEYREKPTFEITEFDIRTLIDTIRILI